MVNYMQLSVMAPLAVGVEINLSREAEKIKTSCSHLTSPSRARPALHLVDLAKEAS